jgi:hypothetical protein
MTTMLMKPGTKVHIMRLLQALKVHVRRLLQALKVHIRLFQAG